MRIPIRMVTILAICIIALLLCILTYGFGGDSIIIGDKMPGPYVRSDLEYWLRYFGTTCFSLFILLVLPAIVSCIIIKRKELLTWKYILTFFLAPMSLVVAYILVFVSPRFAYTW